MQRPVDRPDEMWGKDNHYKIQRHHPFRRLGEAILAFVYITAQKHHEIEHNGTLSREQGWIWEGDPKDHVNRPWPEECERTWTEKFKRQPTTKENI